MAVVPEDRYCASPRPAARLPRAADRRLGSAPRLPYVGARGTAGLSVQLQELMDAIAAHHEHSESNVTQSESGRLNDATAKARVIQPRKVDDGDAAFVFDLYQAGRRQASAALLTLARQARGLATSFLGRPQGGSLPGCSQGGTGLPVHAPPDCRYRADGGPQVAPGTSAHALVDLTQQKGSEAAPLPRSHSKTFGRHRRPRGLSRRAITSVVRATPRSTASSPN